MSVDAQVQELLDQLIDSGATPEEVCRSCPQLLPEVRARWRRMRRVQAELDAMFTLEQGEEATPLFRPENVGLPHIAGYEVEAVLGQGGFGIVFRARNLRLGRPVAIKMLLAGSYAGPTERAWFQREAEAVASVCHANIVQIFEVGDHEGRPYFTMELVDGGSLAQKLSTSPPQLRQAAELVASLADAVAVAHNAGFVHRDLKPANILLTADGIPKISDFGLARRLEGGDVLTLTGTAVGTPSYMAPEQAKGTPGRIGPAADVYGLGAILYELLTGRPPFRGGTALETFRQVLSDEPVPPSRPNPRVPGDLENVCLKCLQKEPQKRYPGAAALAEDLRHYLAGQVVTARPVGYWERAGKWIRRNPAIAGLTAVAVVAFVAGTVASLIFAFEARRQADLATERAGALERQTIELKAQTLAAKENAQLARDNEVETTRVLLSGLLIPFGRNQPALMSQLDGAEWEALRHLRGAPASIRLQFLEAALRDPDAARRVGRRAEWITHAIVGCDRSVRAEAVQRIVRRVQEPETPQDVLLAATRFGVSLNIKDSAWAERSAAAVVVALRDPATPRIDYPLLAESLAVVCELLPPARSADLAAQVFDGFHPRLQDSAKLLPVCEQLGQAVVIMSPWLDADTAARAATALGEGIRLSAPYPLVWEHLSKALVAVSRRLPPPEATTRRHRTVDLILESSNATPVKNKVSDCRARIRALLPLCGGLDSARSARVADAIVAMLGDSEFIRLIKSGLFPHKEFAEMFTSVTERLDAGRNLRAAEELIRVLRRADSVLMPPDELRGALLSVAQRLDTAGMARVADAVIAAARDPETSAEGRTAFAGLFVTVGDRFDRAQTESLERALVDSFLADLAKVKPARPLSRNRLCQSLAAVCLRPGAKCAIHAAESLIEIIRNPDTPIEALEPLVTALVQISGQMAREENSARVNQAIALLDPLWRTRTKPLERAFIVEALAAAWKGVDTVESRGHARGIVAVLEELTRDPKLAPFEHSRITSALAAAYEYLGPAERATRKGTHFAAHANILLAALRNSGNDVATGQLAGTLVAICAHLDRPEAARVFDALLTALNDPERDRYPLAYHKETIKKAIAGLDEEDILRILENSHTAGSLQRVILEGLSEAKHCSFRNTWDYLDRTASRENAASVNE